MFQVLIVNRVARCERYSKTERDHLTLRNLDEYNIPYLAALLSNITEDIAYHERHAQQRGYGPLAECNFMASPSEQKSTCREFRSTYLPLQSKLLILCSAHWHRASDGFLKKGVLRRWAHNCPTTFDIYTPNNLEECPRVVIVSRSPHSHPPPLPTKTPPILVSLLKSLLKDLGWKLADATPRRVVLDSAFMHSLRSHLGWSGIRDPVFSDLHPSLENLDHVRRCINILRNDYYPEGTGLAGKHTSNFLHPVHGIDYC